MMQQILPLANLRVPEKHLTWLAQANAADYWEKRFWFYPFKTRFLHEHGVQDGYDVQIIEKKCWCGDGIWRGMDDHLPKDLWEPCWKCRGTGIYLRKEIELRRWLVGGRLFHEPTSFVVNRSLRTYKETIHGLVKHDEVRGEVGRRAMEKLFLRYEPKRFYELWLSRWRSWAYERKSSVRWNISRVKTLLLRRGEDADVPF